MNWKHWLITLYCVCMASSLHAQTKRALVVGIGEYEDTNWPTIHGDKDVPVVVDMLRGYGYKDVRTLVNRQATKLRMVTELQQLAVRCRANDRVYIHFSGHGQRMTDLDGDEQDGLDETWVPYDGYVSYCRQDKGEKHLVDDELGVLLTAIRRRIGKEGQLLVVADACHSGDSSRELGEGCVRGIERKFIIPTAPADIPRKEKEAEYWLTLSACKDYQSNCELPDGHGKLSYALYRYRNELKMLTNEQLLQCIKDFMEQHRGKLPQTPVLTGDTHYQTRKLFGGM